MRPEYEHTAYVAHLGARLDLRADHESRGVDQAQDRNPVDIAQLHQAGRIVGIICFDGTGHVLAVVGDHAERLTFDTNESVDHAHSIFGAKLQK